MKRYLPLILILLIFALWIVYRPKPDIIYVRINPQVERASIAEDFIGFGYETSAVALPGYFSDENKFLIQLYKNLSPHGMIRIGGNISDHLKYEADGVLSAKPQSAVTVINRKSLKDLAGFLKASGWKAMWGLNLGTASKGEAVELAIAVSEELGESLHSIQIGNEVDLLPRFKKFEEYIAAYAEYKAAIRDVLPQIKFSGPDAAHRTDWVRQFAENQSKDLELLTHHYYIGDSRRPESTIPAMLKSDPTLQKILQNLLTLQQKHSVGFRLNEVNSFYGGGKPNVSDSFASALWVLDFMFQVASYGGNGVNMQTGINHLAWVSHYSPIFNDQYGKLSARPEYYGMLAFSMAGKGRLLEVSTTPMSKDVSIYSSKINHELWIVIINKDSKVNSRLEIEPPTGYRHLTSHRLLAPSLESKTGVTLSGAELPANGAWSPISQPAETITESPIEVELSPGSALLLQLAVD